MKSLVGGICLAVLFTAAPAQATVTTYTFEATVNELTYWDYSFTSLEGPMPSTFVSRGDKLVGKFSVDSDFFPKGQIGVSWSRSLPITDFGYAIPTRGIAQNANYSLLDVVHHEGISDSAQLISYDWDGPRFRLRLGASTETSKADFEFNIDHFSELHAFTLDWFVPGAASQSSLRADLYSLHAQAPSAEVPEPASLGLLALASLALGAVRLRRPKA